MQGSALHYNVKIEMGEPFKKIFYAVLSCSFYSQYTFSSLLCSLYWQIKCF